MSCKKYFFIIINHVNHLEFNSSYLPSAMQQNQDLKLNAF
jgi:hypothetical protein